MTDIEQKARELLAAVYERRGFITFAKYYRGGRNGWIRSEEAIEGITAALRAAPEGFVLVQVELTEGSREAGEQELYMGNDFADAWLAALETMHAARPLGDE